MAASARPRPRRLRRPAMASWVALAMVTLMGQAVPRTFVSAPTRFGVRRQVAQARARRFMALGSDSQELSVADLAGKLRNQGLKGSSPKIGAIFADFVEKLQDAVAEEAAEAAGSQAGQNAGSSGGGSVGASSSPSPPVPARGEVLLEELAALDSGVSREDYFDEESNQWDIEGLEHDLELSRKQAPQPVVSAPAPPQPVVSAPAPPKPAAASLGGASSSVADSEAAEEMLAELIKLDPLAGASKQDYFNEASQQWDMEGLAQDLALSREHAGAAAPAPQMAAPSTPSLEPQTGSGGPEELLAELAQLDPGVSREDYFDEASQQWDIEGLEHDLEISRREKDPPVVADSATVHAAAAAEPEKLLAELKQLDAGVSREDYFDEDSQQWDIEGLQHDLEISKQQVPADPATPPAVAPGTSSQAEELFAELKQLDSGVSREDYFDEDSQQWDLEGLQHDLEISRRQVPAAAAAPATPPAVALGTSSQAEELLAELKQLDSGVSREDYFDEASGSWDIEGLEHDLQISKSAAQEVAPEQLFAKLRGLVPTAGKEDYFDEASGEWDLEGMRDDLSLAEKEAPQTGASAKAMLTELSALDSRVSEADYFDSATGQWDLDGLKEDLQLAKSTSTGTDPEALFAQLSELSPQTSREDYFDEDTSQWDMEGLQEDLRLSRQKQLTAA